MDASCVTKRKISSSQLFPCYRLSYFVIQNLISVLMKYYFNNPLDFMMASRVFLWQPHPLRLLSTGIQVFNYLFVFKKACILLEEFIDYVALGCSCPIFPNKKNQKKNSHLSSARCILMCFSDNFHQIC